MDEKDKQIIAALEQNSRISLKKLARDIDIRTNSIYQRIQKLQNSGIIKRYTVVLDPEKMGLVHHFFLKLNIKKMITGKPDQIYLQSTCKYLATNYDRVMFACVGNDDAIYLLASFTSQADFDQFLADIQEKPLFDEIQTTRIVNVAKGFKMFQYVDVPLDKEEKGDFFDDMAPEEGDEEGDKPKKVYF